MHGGLFYTPKLKAYRSDFDERMKKVPKAKTPRAKAERDMVALQSVWKSIPVTAGKDFEEAFRKDEQTLARKHFSIFFDSFNANMHILTEGFCGDYEMKITLDVVCGIGWLPDPLISRWPAQCPAYAGALAALYPGVKMSKDDKYYALMYMHACLSKQLGAATATVPITLAQTCWFKRAGGTHD